MSGEHLNDLRAKRGGTGAKATEVEKFKSRILEAVANGVSVEKAAVGQGKTYEAVRYHCRKDPAFKRRLDEARGVAENKEVKEVPDFPEFCETYLGMRLYNHQLQWHDVLSGREPRNLHDSMTYVKGEDNMVIINTPPGHAKALALDTVLPTPVGWTTMGEVQVGDKLIGSDGKPVTVTNKSEVFKNHECYTVTFASGEKIVADAGHLWKVNARSNRKQGVLTTEYLYKNQVEGKDNRPVYSVDVAKAFDLPEADLTIEPYTLGVWLGDGNSADSGITIHDADSEIIDYVKLEGYEAKRTIGYRATVYGLRPLLRKANVLKNKHVPVEYLRASYEQRINLLQGLMDTDGTISKTGQASFANKNRNLIDSVYELVRSLGIKARIYESRSVLNGVDHGAYWRVSFYAGNVPVFKLKRKLARQQPVLKGRYTDTIVSIEKTYSVPTQCVTVDSEDSLFLAGKSMVLTHNSKTITMAWVTWQIVKNPDVRILVASKTQNLASQFLSVIKSYLSSDRYAKLHADFGPPEGYDKNTKGWSATQFYVNDRLRVTVEDSVEEKDPTCQATGIGGQVYGMRVDIIVLDDCVDLSNAHQYESQINWLQSEVMSRVPPEGKIVFVGTRLAPRDLYSELQNPERYHGEESPFTYFAQPAVLEFRDSDDWVTLWPKTNVAGIGKHSEKDSNGEYTKWDSESLKKIRSRTSTAQWARVYQQQQVAEDTIFKPEHVKSCVNPSRQPGLLHKNILNSRPNGMDGLHIIAGLDPAAVGHTAAVVLGLDTSDGKRYVLDLFNKPACTPEEIKGIIHKWQDQYKVNEWRIESNAFQKFLTNDVELKGYIASRGGILVGHNTNKWNKHDANFGVMGMAQLFETKKIELPSTGRKEAARALVEQLMAWQPDPPRGLKTDLVMALWFANVRCNELVIDSNVLPNWRHGNEQFVTSFDKKTRNVYKTDHVEFKTSPTYYQWSR